MNDNEDPIQNDNEDDDQNMERTEPGGNVTVEEILEGDDDYASEEDDEDDEDVENGMKNVRRDHDAEKEAMLEDEDNEHRRAVSELRLAVRALWKTGLEIFVHQLLYRRRVYPADTFSSARFVGVECKINRNPSVCIYVAEALKVIMPTIFSDDNDRNVAENPDQGCPRSKEVIVEIYDREKGITHEQFSLSFFTASFADDSFDATSAALFSSFSLTSLLNNQRDDLAGSILREVEKDLRDLVCSTGKLEGLQPGHWDDSVSFKIVLLTNPTPSNNDSGYTYLNTNAEQYAELNKALNDNKWCRSARNPLWTNNRTKNRVIWNLTNSACQFQYRLVPMQKKTTER